MSDFLASIDSFIEKTELDMEDVFKGAASDVSELMTRRQESVKKTGGSYQEGFVPVDEGELINSQQASLNGSVVGEGEAAYTAMIDDMDLGAIAEHVFTAPHARPMEYGFRIADDSDEDYEGDVDVPGRFFVRNAVQQWQAVVDANVRYVIST